MLGYYTVHRREMVGGRHSKRLNNGPDSVSVPSPWFYHAMWDGVAVSPRERKALTENGQRPN